MHCICSGHYSLLVLLVLVTYICGVSSHSIYCWVVCEENACLQRHLPLVTSKSWWMEPDTKAPVIVPKGASCRRSTSAASPPCSGAAAGSKCFLEQALI